MQLLKKIKKQEHLLPPAALADFCRDTGSLLRRGHSLGECFAAMAAKAASPADERRFLALRKGVREGPLADAMRGTGAFPDYMCDMVARGEAAGRTEETLGTLAIYFERERAAVERLGGRAMYPAVMAALAAAILIVTSSFVLPIFADQFAALGLSFSPFARWAMAAGRWLSGLAGVVLTGAVFAGVLLWLSLQNSGWKLLENTTMARKIAAGRFVAALAMFCRCGVDDQTAIEQAAALCGHSDIAPAVARMRHKLAAGRTLPAALASSGLVTGAALGRLRTEGRAEFLLDEAAARMAAETAQRMERLLVRLEPVIVLALSVSAGAILLSVMLPLLGGLAAMA
ncbi:MAG: type II secretion system F family protein [Butyricicoccus sp.]